MVKLFRALAQFIMQGRLQASVIAILGLPVISPAAVALVLLRLGANQGVIVFIAAIAPAIALMVTSMANALMAMVSIAIALALAVAALVLRWSRSWSYALAALLVTTVASTVTMYALVPEQVTELTNTIVAYSKEMVARYGADANPPPAITNRYTLGVMATVSLFAALPCLLLARWWQALLYNPGGFREEFHQLRLGPIVALACLVCGLFHYYQGQDSASWGTVFFLPLEVAGIGLVHWLVARRGLGSQWLVIFYILLLFVAPLRGVIAVLAVLDSVLNLRGRVPPRLRT